MNVRIGLTQSARELEIDLGDDADADQVAKIVADALAGEPPLLWLTDRKGRRVGVVTSKLAYVEVSSERENHSVGFKA